MRNTYAVPTIIDGIQEFKVQSHNDQAEFGGVLGGIINVVSTYEHPSGNWIVSAVFDQSGEIAALAKEFGTVALAEPPG